MNLMNSTAPLPAGGAPGAVQAVPLHQAALRHARAVGQGRAAQARAGVSVSGLDLLSHQSLWVFACPNRQLLFQGEGLKRELG